MPSDLGAQRFRGFRSPNYTQVPDELFDELLSVLSGAELKVLLYIIRRTFGFKRDADAISLSQMMHGITTRDGDRLDRGVGLSKPTLLQALRSLEANNIIETTRQRSTQRGDEPTIYQLKFENDDTHESGSAPVVKKLDQGVVKKPNPPVVKKSAPQETGVQQTERSLSNIRRSTHSFSKNVDNSASQLVALYHTGSSHDILGESEPAHAIASSGADDTAMPTRMSGTETVGDVLKRGRGRPRKEFDPDREPIRAFVEDFAREFNDQASLTASTTRAVNLYRASGVAVDVFLGRLYEARSVVKDRSASIRKQADSGGWAVKNKMPYFFSVVEDLLGLREEAPGSPRATEHAG